ncbi:MAG: helix-turn-helix domain-containing protein [Planctomycetales bacterium]
MFVMHHPINETIGCMEAARLLRVSKTTIKRWRERGDLKGYFLPPCPRGVRVWRIHRLELAGFMLEHDLPLNGLGAYVHAEQERRRAQHALHSLTTAE